MRTCPFASEPCMATAMDCPVLAGGLAGSRRVDRAGEIPSAVRSPMLQLTLDRPLCGYCEGTNKGVRIAHVNDLVAVTVKNDRRQRPGRFVSGRLGAAFLHCRNCAMERPDFPASDGRVHAHRSVNIWIGGGGYGGSGPASRDSGNVCSRTIGP